MAADDELIGVPATTAAKVARVSMQRLHRWEERGLVRPSVRRDLSKRNVVRIYAFPQLVELFVVRDLEDRGLHIRHIGAVVDGVRSPQFLAPLRELRWAIAGGKRKEVLLGYPDGTWSSGERKRDQIVMEGILDLDHIRASVREAVKRTRDAVDEGRAVKRRGVMGSKPVFAGTRTPVSSVQAFVKRGYDNDRILRAYPHLSLADVEYARQELGAA
jgi:DNA-binding transcriptional MerR regulator